MKTEIDALMMQYQMDALLVTGRGDHNPSMVYLTGGGHLTQADLIKKAGQPAVLFHGPMERDEAAKTGLQTHSFSNYPFAALLAEANGDVALAYALRYRRMFEDCGILKGRVALYGEAEVGRSFAIFSRMQELMPGIDFIYDPKEDPLGQAAATKDAIEIDRIRRMGAITTEVVAITADFLTGCAVEDEVLVHPDGKPLTIGDMKRRINLWLSERGAENPEETIFAIGRDGGVPHSSGNPADLIRLGQPIVFDIFPCEAGGGYFYDFTRTWCLGYAPDEVQQLYSDVLSVFKTVVSELRAGERFGEYQRRTCELFEELGHPTVKQQPETEVGYVHSVGHGLGLHVHETPFSGLSTSTPLDVLQPGSVFTIEPGLYYPERGMGVRIEDTLTVNPDGTIEIMAPYPLDLVLKMKNG